jgi:hypothetical protein
LKHIKTHNNKQYLTQGKPHMYYCVNNSSGICPQHMAVNEAAISRQQAGVGWNHTKNTHCITLILTGWMARVPSPAEAKDFSCSLCVQTSYEENQASYPMGTRGHFPEVYRGRGMMLTIHPHLLPWSRMSKSYTSSPLSACMVCSFTFFLTYYSNTD